jgi:hypothetical protein
MKKLIIILAIVACATVAQAEPGIDPTIVIDTEIQRKCNDNYHNKVYTNFQEFRQQSHDRYVWKFQNCIEYWKVPRGSPYASAPTPYPPDYFKVPSMSVEIPSGPVHGYPGMRYWNPSTGLYEASPYLNNW